MYLLSECAKAHLFDFIKFKSNLHTPNVGCDKRLFIFDVLLLGLICFILVGKQFVQEWIYDLLCIYDTILKVSYLCVVYTINKFNMLNLILI